MTMHYFTPNCLLGVSSVMRMPPSVTRDCTWACPAVKRTSTAAPTCRPTCLFREAPKRHSGSPRYSAPPNSHKMVITSSLCPTSFCFVFYYAIALHSIRCSSVFSGPSGSAELEGPPRQSVGHPRSTASNQWRGDCQGRCFQMTNLIIRRM